MVFTIVLSSVIATSTCNNKNNSSAIPRCIQMKIETLQKAPVQNPAAIVISYIYNGSEVYHFNAPCCDQFSLLYDENCALICHPEGGITGNGDGKCSDFLASSTDRKILWKDSRIRN